MGGPDVGDGTSMTGFPLQHPSAPIETTLKLVCSMSANRRHACWEDVTDTTPLTFTSGGVQFTSVVSASFWVIDCPKWMSNDVMSLVDQLYKVRNLGRRQRYYVVVQYITTISYQVVIVVSRAKRVSGCNSAIDPVLCCVLFHQRGFRQLAKKKMEEKKKKNDGVTGE